jgi:hypothetical protein
LIMEPGSRQRSGTDCMRGESHGKLLGRPPGARNKAARKLDAYKDQIENYLKMGLSISAVKKIINSQQEKALSYSAYVFFIKRDGVLAGILVGRGH